MDDTSTRADVLRALGAAGPVVDELLAYNANRFDHSGTATPGDEPFVADWERYAEDAGRVGVFSALRGRLVQLRFPVRAGISATEAYQAATRRGVFPDGELSLREPGRLELELHASAAGRVPVLFTPCRDDFVLLVQALAGRNEPTPVPPSMGATLISGLNNWDRVAAHRRRWEQRPAGTWAEEFRRLVPRRHLYQDRLILLSDGPYSGVRADELGLSDAEWLSLSRVIRREHEAAHYFTLRALGSMRDNLLDELIADHAGLVAAVGRFRADWCLRFLGLERFPDYRPGGRLENYRGRPPLTDDAVAVLRALAFHAAVHLERLDALRPALGPAAFLVALSRLTLERLASAEHEAHFRAVI